MTIDSPPDGQDPHEHDRQDIAGKAERQVTDIALDCLDAVQALMDLEQEPKRSERAFLNWARRGDRRAEASRHALRFVLMEKLADDLIAIRDGARTPG